MDVVKKQNIGELLIKAEKITAEQLEYAMKNKKEDEKLWDFLIKVNFVSEQQLIETLATQLNVPQINVSEYDIDPKIVQLVPAELAKRALVMPIRLQNNVLLIAMADPMDYFAIEEVRIASGHKVEPAIASKQELTRIIQDYYDTARLLKRAEEQSIVEQQPQVQAQPAVAAEDETIELILNKIIENAVLKGASHIHFDPLESEFRVRLRIDSKLHLESTLPKHIQPNVTTLIKKLSNIKLVDSAIPQEGASQVRVGSKTLDFQVSTLPTLHGEKIVMRVLDLSYKLKGIEELGLTRYNEALFRTMLENKHGVILIAGGDDTGKTTTLYAALDSMKDQNLNIITLEKEVKYLLENVNQIQINEAVGLTYEAGLRSVLMHDPDVIMLGEIRNLQTAQIAFQSATQERVIYATIKANDVSEAIARLRILNLDPFMTVSSLAGIMAQKLVRCVCKNCVEKGPATKREQELFIEQNIHVDYVSKGRGCSTCNYTGYSGQTAIHEILPINRQFHRYLLTPTTADEITAFMKQNGYHTMLQDGLFKVLQGITTTEEVLRVVMNE